MADIQNIQSKACAAPQHTASWLTMVASFGSKPGNGKSEVKAMTNHQSRECRNVYISSSEPPVQWPVEEWETIMASIQMPLEAEMQQKATKTEEDEMQTTATILTIENLD